jgi:hypothetical protein
LKHSSDGIDESDIIRTGCPAIVTANTAVRVNHDDPIFPPISGLHRADGIADGTLAVVT